MKIVMGTSNSAKVEQMRLVLGPLGIDVCGADIGIDVPEAGGTASENVRAKALAYARAIGACAMATDYALRFDGVSPEEQPGPNVRRIPAHPGRPTDAEMLRYYADLFHRYGGTVVGRWEFAVAVAAPDGILGEVTILTPDRHFVDIPSRTPVDGFPLASLQIDPVSGRYASEMSEAETLDLWYRGISDPLRDFFRSLRWVDCRPQTADP